MYDSIVSTIYGLLHGPFSTAYPDVPLVLENQPFDWGNPPDRFVTVEVEFYDGGQVGASSTPKTRFSGCVYISAYARKGQGTMESLRILGTLGGLLAYRGVGTLQLKAAAPAGAADNRDFYSNELKVPFHADSA